MNSPFWEPEKALISIPRGVINLTFVSAHLYRTEFLEPSLKCKATINQCLEKTEKGRLERF